LLMKDLDHPYAAFLLDVEKPIRYIGGEYGCARPSGGLSVALAFPDTYEIGMSFLGFHILYDILRREPGIEVERVFAPWPDLEEKLRAHEVPLVSLETRKPLSSFDVVGFSLQYELTATNVLAMLELGGIPLRAAERSQSDPIVVGGGPLAFQPEPLAPFFDAFVLGDGEEILPQLVRAVGELKSQGAPREAVLRRLASFQGVYVPALVPVSRDPQTGLLVAREGVRIERTPAVDLEKYPFPASWPVPDTEIVFDRFSVEIARGCPAGCRFCQGGFIYRPVRVRSARQIIETIRRASRHCGFDTVSLTSLSTADYPHIGGLIRFLAKELESQGVALSVSSLRAYDIPEDLLEALGLVRQATLTFALEAGTAHLRSSINKVIREQDILKTAERVFSRGWQRMKLYFMIGLPGETDGDVRAIIEVTKSVSEIARRFGRRATRGVTASVSTLVPKPHTAFQWAPMLSYEEIKRRQHLLFLEAKRHRLSLKWHDATTSLIEGIIARGDRQVGEAIERAYRLGCRFDGWADRLKYDLWEQAFRETGVDPDRYLKELPVEGRLPWDHIHTGVEIEFLRREWERAQKGRITEPCYFTGLCHNCGAGCDLAVAQAQPEPLPPPAASPPKPRQPVPFRIAFRRGGRLRFVSQLDLVRSFPRIFRRAGLPLAWSQGLRPKPLMSFPPALPLGAAALRDLVDVRLNVLGTNGQEVKRKLSGVVPDGLQILSARPLAPWEKKLSRRIQAIDNAVSLPPGLSPEAVSKRVGSFLDADEVTVTVRETERSRSFDLRSWVLEARVVERIEGLSEEEGAFLFFRTKPEARPLLVASHLLGTEIRGDRLYRLDLLAAGPLGFTSIR